VLTTSRRPSSQIEGSGEDKLLNLTADKYSEGNACMQIAMFIFLQNREQRWSSLLTVRWGLPDLVLIYFASPSHPYNPVPRTWPTRNISELIGMRT
jgi:hypothetical protein